MSSFNELFAVMLVPNTCPRGRVSTVGSAKREIPGRCPTDAVGDRRSAAARRGPAARAAAARVAGAALRRRRGRRRRRQCSAYR